MKPGAVPGGVWEARQGLSGQERGAGRIGVSVEVSKQEQEAGSHSRATLSLL